MPDGVEPIAVQAPDVPRGELTSKHDADYVFYELTRSICPTTWSPSRSDVARFSYSPPTPVSVWDRRR